MTGKKNTGMQQLKTIIASATAADARTPYKYEPPGVHGGQPDKSFVLHKSAPGAKAGLLLHLPVSRCQVLELADGYLEIELPEWLWEKNKSFFD